MNTNKSGMKGRMIAIASVGLMCLMAFTALAPVASAAAAPSWNYAVPMGEARSQATVVQADNGVVYVIGGYVDTTTNPVNTVSAYNPSTGAWVNLASLPSATRGASGGIGADGRIYIFDGTTQATQIYNITTDTWSAGATSPTPGGLWEAKSAINGDHAYVFGGEGIIGYEYQTWIYNMTTDAWWSGADMLYGVTSGAVVADGTYAYYFGGENASGMATTDVSRYSFAADSWSMLAPLPSAVCAEAAVIGPDGLIYVFGGADTAYNVGMGAVYSSTYTYDRDSNTWMTDDDMNVARAWLGAAVSVNKVLSIGGNTPSTVYATVESLATVAPSWNYAFQMGGARAQAVVVQADNGIVYVIGGVTAIYGAVNTVSAYNPSTGTWANLAPLLTATRGASGEIGADGRIYIFDGVTHGTQIYNIATDTWSAGAASPTPGGLWEAKSAINGDHVYVFGGEDDDSYEIQTWIYEMTTDTWSSGADMLYAAKAGAVVADGEYAYYIGGADVSDMATTKVSRYSFATDSWSMLAPLPSATCGEAAAIGPDGLIYVFGGADSPWNTGMGAVYSAAYTYDRDSNTWAMVDGMNIPRAWLGAAVSDNKILAIGGNTQTTIYSIVESLDTLQNQLNNLQKQVTLLQSQLATAQADIALLQSQLATSQTDITLLQSQLATAQASITLLQSQLATAQASITLLQSQLSVAQADITLLQSQLAIAQVDISDLMLDVADLTNKNTLLNAKLNQTTTDLNAALNLANNKIADLTNKNTLLNAKLNQTIDDLNATDVALGNANDNVNNAKSAADSANMIGMIGMIIGIVAILIAVVALVMKKKTSIPPMPPQ